MASFDHELRGRLILRSVLPLIKVLPEERPFFRTILKKAKGVVQFAAKDSEQAAYVEFGDGIRAFIRRDGIRSVIHIRQACAVGTWVSHAVLGVLGGRRIRSVVRIRPRSLVEFDVCEGIFGHVRRDIWQWSCIGRIGHRRVRFRVRK